MTRLDSQGLPTGRPCLCRVEDEATRGACTEMAVLEELLVSEESKHS
jgi:hypothetical protein